MDREFQSRVERVFHEAASLPAPSRPALLDERCAGDAELRRVVESLLRADTAPVGSARLARDGGPDDAAGTPIGPYRIISLIGEGGFGAVYLAEQSRPIRRRVAVKVIKAGMDTRKVVARFEAERQVLALMEHPNIARVLDAGATPRGQPYFVMEHVPGVPLTRFCDQERLDVDGRLALFLEVCSAIHHAHQKGVIHRDLKPSNILVEAIDGRAVPKVIDFGIAKAAADPRGEWPTTEHGGVLGTPEYMSPEQADMGGRDVDTRTDVYSLGVVLYELLTGVPPLDGRALRSGPAADLARRLRDLPAVRPSTRLRLLSASRVAPPPPAPHSASGTGEEPSPAAGPPDPEEIAARRGCDLPSLRRRLRGDLDWILLRAMEKDRARRYASVSEFAADIERHLSGHAVVARPPSTAYLARKFVRRHRAGAAAGLLVAVILVAATALSSVMALREAAHRREAERSRAQTRLQSYQANLAAAAMALEHGDYPLAERSLAAAPEELRGWEWRALNWQADRSLLQLPGHAGETRGRVSPDGSTLWTVDAAGDARAWDLATGALRRRVRVAPCDQLVAVSADGSTIVTWTQDNVLSAWDAATGRGRWSLPGYNDGMCGSPHPDGAHLVVLSPADGSVRLLALDSGELGEVLLPPLAVTIWHPACSPDGRWLLVAAHSGQTMLYDLHRREMRATITSLRHTFDPSGEAIHFLEPVLATSTEFRSFDLARGVTTIRPFPPVNRSFPCVLSPNGRFVVTIDAAGTIHVGDEHGTTPRPLYRHAGGCHLLLVTPDSRRVVSGGADGCVRVWDIRTGEGDHVVNHDWFPSGFPASVSAALGALATIGWGEVALWDAPTGALRWSRTVSRHALVAAAFADRAGLVAVLDSRGQVFLLHAATGEPAGGASLGAAGDVARLVITTDAAHVVAVTAERAVIVSLRDGPREGAPTVLPAGIGPVALSPDGARLALTVLGASGKHVLRVLAFPSGAPAWEAPLGDTEPLCLAFHPRGGVGAALADGTVCAFGPDGAPLARLVGAAPRVRCLAMHPAEPLVAAGSDDGVVHFVRLDRGSAALSLRTAGRHAIQAAAFSDDGESLTLGGALCTVTTMSSRPPAEGYGPRFLASRALRALARSVLVAKGQLGLDAHERLAEDASLPAEVMEEALRLAHRVGPPANVLNSVAWGWVREPGQAGFSYERALASARAALSVFPEDASIMNTHGYALYRAGRWEEAAAALARSDAISVRAGRGELPHNAAALAMTLHRLGRSTEALDALDRTRRLAALPAYAQDWEVRMLLHEAEGALTEPRPAGKR